MPSSDPEWISHICNRLLAISPRTALDIGPGYGKFGVLYHEYCNTYRKLTDGRIDAVEIFKPYAEHLRKTLPLVYGNIFEDDILRRLDLISNYQCVICTDMLEHINKEDGHRLLKAIAGARSGFVTTPVNWFPSSNHLGNENERHQCLWTAEELSAYGEVRTGKVLHLLEVRAS